MADRGGSVPPKKTGGCPPAGNERNIEPTIQHGNCLVRVDILIKRGNAVDLIEVKSKGFDSTRDSFRGKRGPIASEWRPYLYDVAFQQHVFQQAHPQWLITPYLMLIDPTARAAIAGVGAMFQVERVDNRVQIAISPAFDAAALAPPLLRAHDVSQEVQLLVAPVVTQAGVYEFNNLIDWLSAELEAGRALPVTPGAACKRCEFYCDPGDVTTSRLSGWGECMTQALNINAGVARPDTVFGLYNHRGVEDLLAARRHNLRDLTEADLKLKRESGKISATQRHLHQVQEAQGALRGVYWERDPLERELRAWQLPLHFIDFETARPTLPYQLLFTPNQQLLFQFSHHVVEQREHLRHHSEFLLAAPTVAPSITVLRALRAALGKDEGTVVHWWDHEKTVLRDLARQIGAGNQSDKHQLLNFISDLVGTDGKPGRLADLGRLISCYAFFAGTGGSSSIKKVLPAVLRQSPYLRARYGAPIYGTSEMPSLNFPPGWIWYQEKDGRVIDPYDLLGPVFTDPVISAALSSGADEEAASPEFIASGGGAMVAYGGVPSFLVQ